MELIELFQRDFTGKDVLIIGQPASGKTYVSRFLKGDQVVHTDDFMAHGYEGSLLQLMKYLHSLRRPVIVEGVLGYRLLRKGVQNRSYRPDVVIELLISEEQQMEVYMRERDESKLKYLKQFNATHQKILAEYKAMENSRKPEWITIFNHY